LPERLSRIFADQECSGRNGLNERALEYGRSKDNDQTFILTPRSTCTALELIAPNRRNRARRRTEASAAERTVLRSPNMCVESDSIESYFLRIILKRPSFWPFSWENQVQTILVELAIPRPRHSRANLHIPVATNLVVAPAWRIALDW